MEDHYMPDAESIDLSQMKRWAHVDRLSLQEFAHSFLASVHADMIKVDAALEQNDLDALNFLGHHIGGAAAVVGFWRFAELSRALGTSGSKGASVEELRDIVNQMHQIIAGIRVQTLSGTISF